MMPTTTSTAWSATQTAAAVPGEAPRACNWSYMCWRSPDNGDCPSAVRRTTANTSSTSGYPTNSSATSNDAPDPGTHDNTNSVASAVPRRYAPPSPRYTDAGGRLYARNA